MNLAKTLKSNWWIGLIVLALSLRLVFAAFLFHPDLKDIYREARLMSINNISGAYVQGVKNNTPLHYPPLIYLIDNFHQFFDGWMFSQYYPTWMNDWSAQQTINHPHIFQDLLVMKLPLLAADLLVTLFLISLAPIGKKRLTAALWLLNPFSLYAIYAFGNFDIFPTLFIVVSLWFFYREKYNFSYAALGVGSAFKLFPLLLLPFLFFKDPRPIKQRTIGVLTTLVTFIILISPIIISKTAIKSIFFSNLTTGLYHANIDLGGGVQLPLYLSFYVILVIAVSSKLWQKVSLESIYFLSLGGLFVLSNFHPQWLLWLMPLVCLMLVEEFISWEKALGLMSGYLGISLLIDDKFVSFGLFKAINNSFDSFNSIRSYLDKFLIGPQLQNLMEAIFFAFFVWIALELIKIAPLQKSLSLVKIHLLKISSIWIISLIGLFIIIHIPLTILGQYIDTSSPTEHERIVLIPNLSLMQQFVVNHNNFNALSIRLKNVNLKNKSPIKFDILNSDKQLVREIPSNGQFIGDDDNYLLNFPKITNSKNQAFYLTIFADPAPKGQELIVPYDETSPTPGLFINTKPVTGRLAFTTYYNPGNLFDNLAYSLQNIMTKLLP